jgi:site-specific DNA recombinase
VVGQREAGEAYVKSQQHEGWLCLPDRYDDGGFSGGTTDRPAFQRLLSDVEDGKVDCILVYKIDRLSRSLMDFAKIIECLDRCQVSLVSVTQQFNTTTSMGRLTLNILLSFAQFEREIISERTRDKIAMARRKGKWTGGPPILGYDREKDDRGSRLVVNEEEAERVRAIFQLYLEKGSLGATLAAIQASGTKTKRFQTTLGHWRGGLALEKSSLQKMLTNITYLGKISFKEDLFDGEHDAIVDENTWREVQKVLRQNGRNGSNVIRNKYGALLKGLLYCKPCKSAMIHTYTSKGNRQYRYYVCVNAQKRGWDNCPTKSIPAHEIERFVVDQIRAVGKDRPLRQRPARPTRRRPRRRRIRRPAARGSSRRRSSRRSANGRSRCSSPGTSTRGRTCSICCNGVRRIWLPRSRCVMPCRATCRPN